MKQTRRNKNLKICPHYVRGGNCDGENVICGEQLGYKNELICCSKLYYAMDLEKQITRLEWYLEEIRYKELQNLDIDSDEYKTNKHSTDYSSIINLVEEALHEIPQEDCRYKEEQ